MTANIDLDGRLQPIVEAEKQAALGQLAHGIAHELNTPLGVIISNLSVLGTYADSLKLVATSVRDTIQRLRAGESPDAVVASLEEELAAAEMEYLVEDLPALASESIDAPSAWHRSFAASRCSPAPTRTA